MLPGRSREQSSVLVPHEHRVVAANLRLLHRRRHVVHDDPEVPVGLNQDVEEIVGPLTGPLRPCTVTFLGSGFPSPGSLTSRTRTGSMVQKKTSAFSLGRPNQFRMAPTLTPGRSARIS
jgi:hypothetical protein